MNRIAYANCTVTSDGIILSIVEITSSFVNTKCFVLFTYLSYRSKKRSGLHAYVSHRK